MTSSSKRSMSYTLRSLSALLRYPSPELFAHLPEVEAAIKAEDKLSAAVLNDLSSFIARLQATDLLEAQETYVELFDHGRSTSLALFEHVHGDSRDRGSAMVDLVKTYEKAGLLLGTEELPDHLCVLLEYASTQPDELARKFIGEFAHLLAPLHTALVRRGGGYAVVIAALLSLADAPIEDLSAESGPDREPTLDESWEEPAAFGGCSTAGQQAAGAPQPVQFIRSPLGTAPRAQER